jgi:hypothetical protein
MLETRTFGKHIHTWEDNIKMYPKGRGWKVGSDLSD